jgi:hypothetical protein
MNPDEITVWLTDNALTTGICKKTARISNIDISGKTIYVQIGKYTGAYFHGQGIEWHRTESSAIARADEMRKAKIASLKKQIANLKKLKFEREEK